MAYIVVQTSFRVQLRLKLNISVLIPAVLPNPLDDLSENPSRWVDVKVDVVLNFH